MDHFQLGIITMAISGIFTVLWHLLRKKDDQQERQINDLYEKHNQDSQRLQDLELKIAENHYNKAELNDRFDRLERSISEGLNTLAGKLDKLTDALIHTPRKDHD